MSSILLIVFLILPVAVYSDMAHGDGVDSTLVQLPYDVVGQVSCKNGGKFIPDAAVELWERKADGSSSRVDRKEFSPGKTKGSFSLERKGEVNTKVKLYLEFHDVCVRGNDLWFGDVKKRDYVL